jgi:hypothetical protein
MICVRKNAIPSEIMTPATSSDAIIARRRRESFRKGLSGPKLSPLARILRIVERDVYDLPRSVMLAAST